MPASSSGKYPSVFHTSAPSAKNRGANLQAGTPSVRLAAARTPAARCPLAVTSLAWASRSPAPQPQVFTHPLHLLQSPPLPPDSIPFLCVPLPRCHPRSGRLRPAPTAPGRAGHLSPRFHGAADAPQPRVCFPSPRPERCRLRSYWARQFGPLSSSS